MAIEVDVPVSASGECRCHGVQVEGPLALKSRPKQPYWEQDLMTGQRVACWFVLTDHGAHDIAVADATVTYKSGAVQPPSNLAVRYCDKPNCEKCGPA